MYAIKENGIGKPVNFRRVIDQLDLSNGESFVVADNPVGLVLAEDSISLRPPNASEIVSIENEKKVVTKAQARIAMHNSGHLAEVEAFINDALTDPIFVIAYNDTDIFERNSPTLKAIQAAMGWSDALVDSLFDAAIQVQV